MRTDMLALKLLGSGKTKVMSVPVPLPKENEVLIKVYSSAICGSEKEDYLKHHDKGVLSGHEVVGIVDDASKSKILKEGDKVAVYALYGCGECHYCMIKQIQFCSNFQGVSNSGHAQYTVCRDINCIKIKEDIPFDEAVLIYGDAMGVAHRAMKSSLIKKDSTAYVIGAGPIGLGIIAYLKHLNVKVIVGEPIEYRREIALEKVLADKAINPFEEDVEIMLKHETDGLGPEYVFECSGNSVAEIAALNLVRCGGTVCFAGENQKGLTIIPSQHIIHKEVHLTGAFYYSPEDIKGILKEYRNGFDISRVVTHIFSLKQADKAFDMFMKGETGKVIIHPWD